MYREVRELFYGVTSVVHVWPCACAEHGSVPGHWHAVGTGAGRNAGSWPGRQVTAGTREEARLQAGLQVIGLLAFAPSLGITPGEWAHHDTPQDW